MRCCSGPRPAKAHSPAVVSPRAIRPGNRKRQRPPFAAIYRQFGQVLLRQPPRAPMSPRPTRQVRLANPRRRIAPQPPSPRPSHLDRPGQQAPLPHPPPSPRTRPQEAAPPETRHAPRERPQHQPCIQIPNRNHAPPPARPLPENVPADRAIRRRLSAHTHPPSPKASPPTQQPTPTQPAASQTSSHFPF